MYGMTAVVKSATNSSVAALPIALPGPRDVWPAGMTTIIGRACFAAMRLSRMKPARPTDDHASSLSPAPCNR